MADPRMYQMQQLIKQLMEAGISKSDIQASVEKAYDDFVEKVSTIVGSDEDSLYGISTATCDEENVVVLWSPLTSRDLALAHWPRTREGELSTNVTLLDADCGAGTIAKLITEEEPRLKIASFHGLDSPQSMLGIANERALYQSSDHTPLPAEPWPVRDSFADLTMCSRELVEDTDASTLDELLRATKVGGHCMFAIRQDSSEAFRSKMHDFELDDKWLLVDRFAFRKLGEASLYIQYVFQVRLEGA